MFEYLKNQQTASSLRFLHGYTQPQMLTFELQKIDEQTHLLQKISDSVASRKAKQSTPTLSLETVEDTLSEEMEIENNSQISVFSLGFDLKNYSFSYQDTLRFGNQYRKCLHEIKEKCSSHTFELMSQVLEKRKESTFSKKQQEKQRSEIANLNQKIIILEAGLKNANQEGKKIKEEAESLKRKLSSQLQRQNGQKQQAAMLRKEEALIYQHKCCKKMHTLIQAQIHKLQEVKAQCDQLNSKSEKDPTNQARLLRSSASCVFQPYSASKGQCNDISIQEIGECLQKLTSAIERMDSCL